MAFSDHPLTYKTKNIFKRNIYLEQPQFRTDISVKNLDLNSNIKTIIDINNIKLNISKESISFDSSGIYAQSNIDKEMELALFEVDSALFKYMIEESTKDSNLEHITLAYQISNLNVFNANDATKSYKAKHSKGIFILGNMDKNFRNKAKSSDPKEFAKNAIESFVKNNTKIVVADFKHTDTSTQSTLKAELLIGKDYFLSANADFNIKFFKPLPIIQNYLNSFKFEKSETGNYAINMRTDKNIIKVNNNITIPAPFFKPEKPQAQQGNI